jgi:hypothetical protein
MIRTHGRLSVAFVGVVFSDMLARRAAAANQTSSQWRLVGRLIPVGITYL